MVGSSDSTETSLDDYFAYSEYLSVRTRPCGPQTHDANSDKDVAGDYN